MMAAHYPHQVRHDYSKIRFDGESDSVERDVRDTKVTPLEDAAFIMSARYICVFAFNRRNETTVKTTESRLWLGGKLNGFVPADDPLWTARAN